MWPCVIFLTVRGTVEFRSFCTGPVCPVHCSPWWPHHLTLSGPHGFRVPAALEVKMAAPRLATLRSLPGAHASETQILNSEYKKKWEENGPPSQGPPKGECGRLPRPAPAQQDPHRSGRIQNSLCDGLLVCPVSLGIVPNLQWAARGSVPTCPASESGG